MDKKSKWEINIIAFLVVALTFLVLFSFRGMALTKFKDNSKEPIYFGATYMTMNNPYFGIINEEIKKRIEVNGDKLITLDPALSLEKQRKQIRYLIEQDIRVLFVNPIEKDGLHEVLEECREANIIVIAVDSNLNQNDYVSYTLVSDNYDAGVQVANDMMKRRTKADIVLLEHKRASSATLRIKGFTDTIKKADQYRIVERVDCEGQLELATPLINSLIERGPKFDVIIALNDPSAMGALAALQNKQIQNILVYGVDGTPEVKALINNHRMTGSVSQSPILMGRRAVSIAYQLLDDKQPREDKIPVELIVQENIHEYALEGWQ